jgi:hypothetical protein
MGRALSSSCRAWAIGVPEWRRRVGGGAAFAGADGHAICLLPYTRLTSAGDARAVPAPPKEHPMIRSAVLPLALALAATLSLGACKKSDTGATSNTTPSTGTTSSTTGSMSATPPASAASQ